MRNKTQKITIAVSPRIKGLIEKLAQQNETTISAWLTQAIMEKLGKEGVEVEVKHG